MKFLKGTGSWPIAHLSHGRAQLMQIEELSACHDESVRTLVHLERCWKQFLIWSGASPTARYSCT